MSARSDMKETNAEISSMFSGPVATCLVRAEWSTSERNWTGSIDFEPVLNSSDLYCDNVESGAT